jgi:acetolactate synthase-1/2/3 large subunit
MKVFEALATALVAEECGPIFSLMGDANLALLTAFARHPGQKIISARNEAGAVAMADGYSRATGRVGVATITCGPGLTQTGTSLVAASRNGSPLVIVTGDTPQHWPIKLQLLNQQRFVEACECRYRNVDTVETLAADILEAFFAARTLSKPVVLSLRLDMLEEDVPDDWQYRPARSFFSAPGIISPDMGSVQLLADELARSGRPVIIAGRGAVLAGARDALLSIGARVGALLGTTLLARGLFSGEDFDAGIIGGFAASATVELLAEADCVVAVGAELGHFTTMGNTLFPKARVVRVDIAPLPWSSGMPPGLYVQGDARETMLRLDAELSRRAVRRDGYRTDAKRSLLTRPVALPPRANDGVDPRRLMLRLSECLDGNVVVTSGVGHFWSFPSIYLDLPSGAEMRFSIQFGSVGQTLPIAIGQAVAEPEKLHICIEGDASLLMNIQEFDTAARHKLPLIVLIFNDGALGAEVHKLNRKGFDASLAVFESPDFVLLARGFGGDGIVLRSEDEIGPAIEAGRKAGGLFVIDARISPTTVSDPYLRSLFGKPAQSPLIQGYWRAT